MTTENTIYEVEKIYIYESEPGFVEVKYYAIDDGLDLGSWLYIERASVPTLIEMLSQRLNGYGQGEILRQSGNDSFQIQPFYDILNRRNGEVLHSGHRGFLMPKSDAEELLKLLSDLAAKPSTELIGEMSERQLMESAAKSITEMSERQLLQAAANGDLNAVGKALTSGADVNVHNQYKQSALNIAAEKGHLYVVAILLAADADIENLDVGDKSPLMAASFHGKTRVSELLLRHGAVINRDLLSSLKLKVDIFEESVGGAGLVSSDEAAAWRKFLDFMIEKWHKQNEKVSP